MANLNIGSTGEDVRALQQKLKSAGFDPGPIDAIFGPKTAAAVTAYQKANNLTVDAIAGPQTLESLSQKIIPISGTGINEIKDEAKDSQNIGNQGTGMTSASDVLEQFKKIQTDPLALEMQRRTQEGIPIIPQDMPKSSNITGITAPGTQSNDTDALKKALTDFMLNKSQPEDYKKVVAEMLAQLPPSQPVQSMTMEQANQQAKLNIPTKGQSDTLAMIENAIKNRKSSDYKTIAADIMSQIPQYEAPKRLSFDEYMAQAEANLNPQYQKSLENIMKATDIRDINRGFYGQLPAEALKRETAQNEELNRQIAVSNLANQLMMGGEQNALAREQMNMAKQGQNLDVLTNALNMASGQERNYMTDLYNLAGLQGQQSAQDIANQQWEKGYASDLYNQSVNQALAQQQLGMSQRGQNLDVLMNALNRADTQGQNRINNLLNLLGVYNQENQFNVNKALQEAGLTGTYQGKPTLEATNLAKQLTMQEAGLTGMYGGQPTMQGKAADIERQINQETLTRMQNPDSIENKQALTNLRTAQAQLKQLNPGDPMYDAKLNEIKANIARLNTETSKITSEQQDSIDNAALAEAYAQLQDGTLKEWWNKNKTDLAKDISTSTYNKIMNMILNPSDEYLANQY